METGLVISTVLLWIVVLFNMLLTLAIVRRLNLTVSSQRAGLRKGQIAPDFTAQTLTGENVTLQDYAGQPTAFVFISTHCNPCENILPELETHGPQAKQAGVDLVLVCDNPRKETQSYVIRKDIHLPVLIAPRNEHPFFQNYQIQGTPSYCYIDKQGKVQAAGHPTRMDSGWKALSDGWAKGPIKV